MEPAPEERDDPAGPVAPHRLPAAAMEPAPEERDDQNERLRTMGFNVPQWSPLLKSGMTRLHLRW